MNESAVLIPTAIVMIVAGTLYVRWHNAQVRRSIVLKSLASFMAVLIALYYAEFGGNKIAYLFAVAFLLCSAADALLELAFFKGVFAFGIAQALFVVGYVLSYGFHWQVYAFFAVVFGVIYLIFRKDIPQMEGGVRLLIYVGFLTLAFASAVVPFLLQPSMERGLAAAGATLFLLSDAMIGLSKIKAEGDEGHSSAAVMISYYLALFLIACSLRM